jgi:hypothetical protein
MIGVVATIKVKPGMEKEFETVAKELVARVRAHEPGCSLYALHHAETPHTYVFMEPTPTRPPWKRIAERSISRLWGVRWANTWTAGPK